MTAPTAAERGPRRLSGSSRGWDVGISVTVLCLGAVVLCVTFLLALFGILLTTSCDGACRLGMFTLGWLAAMIVPFVLLVAGAIWSVVRMIRAQRALVVAIATILLAFAAWCGGMALMIGAVPGLTF
ncbi:hypothetical protein SAMN04489806_1787 [Paramicrobacterium humi]|uniref:Uncharacterized protein n=1 Tax=Paramicrobacterium humi TaxID=640635 RepID=A0A1H4MA92_9MICO|nr:hypothetical protein [Microbacterium humi]SEB79272.1 hypothetical protein SAMN04489806_1787 [Microbacterium humi]